jgi:hypothetical protein
MRGTVGLEGARAAGRSPGESRKNSLSRLDDALGSEPSALATLTGAIGTARCSRPVAALRAGSRAAAGPPAEESIMLGTIIFFSSLLLSSAGLSVDLGICCSVLCIVVVF